MWKETFGVKNERESEFCGFGKWHKVPFLGLFKIPAPQGQSWPAWGIRDFPEIQIVAPSPQTHLV